MSVGERIAALSPEQRNLFDKLREQQRQAASVHQPPPIRRVSGPTGEGDWPLSLDQERFWFMEQLHPGGAGLNLSAASRLRGPVAVPRVAAALDQIVRRHAAWRTAFPAAGGSPVQRVSAGRQQRLARIDLSALPAARRQAETLRLVGEDAAAPFDLEAGPLVRASLLELDAEDRVCLLTIHHLVTDFLSFQIAWSELAAFYAAFVAGHAPALPEPPVQYPDFAVWQRGWLQGDVLAGLASWWRERLHGFPLALALPTDRPRPPLMRMRGGRRRIEVPRDLSEAWRALARAESVTLFMAVLAAAAALLHRISYQEKLILGANNANRNRPELQPVIGTFLTQVPFPLDLAGDPTFRELLARVRETALAAYAHQDLPFGTLVEAIQPPRDTSRQPVIQTLVQVLAGETSGASLEGVSFEPVDAHDGKARYDLLLTLFDNPGGLVGSLEYDADLFDAATAARLVELLGLQVQAFTADSGRHLGSLPALSPGARHQVLTEWNDVARPLPAWTAPERFFAQATRMPEAPAIVAGGETLTYGEVDRRSTALARRLRDLGVAPEERVALLLGRTADVAVAMLAAWKAGGAFVPLDPTAPAERLADQLADAEPAAVIHRGPLSIPRAAEVRSVDLGSPVPPAGEADSWQPAVHPGQLAYLIYTSGTTGRSKAVAVEHGSLALVLATVVDRFGFAAGDRMLHLARFSFDIALIELFAPLLTGGLCEILSEDDVLDPDRLLAAIERATRVHAVPSLMARIVAEARRRGPERLPGLRTLITGGDRVAPELLADLLATFRGAGVEVLYGPTETTIVCAGLTVREGQPWRPLLGRPLDNVELRVVDPGGGVVPLGVPGELWVGGPGVARGYHRRDELTAERFVEVDGRRFYRTGDLARHLPMAGGVLEFLGRTDLQVKIRGFRIEPGEIEAALTEHPAVRQAVVVARADGAGELRLVGYVVPEGACPASELRALLAEHLAARLPAYMVPAAFVILPELPLTPHGKVDRSRLPAAEVSAEPPAGDAPRSPAEEVVAGIWCEVLGLPRVSRSADFFALGGHSLLATRVVSRLRAATGAELPIRELFLSPTVAALATALQASLATGLPAAAPVRPAPRDRDLPLSFAQERLWFLDRLAPGNAAYNIPLALAVHGELSLPALAAALAEMVRRHEVLRTTYESKGDRPAQVIAPPAPPGLPLVDLSGLRETPRREEARRVADETVAAPFDLARDPVLRARAVRLAPAEHALLLTLHHIAADGWSVGVILEEVAALYPAALAGASSPLPELAVQYADFAVWQRQWLQGEVLERQLEYWRRRLAGLPALELPTDRLRAAAHGFRGATRLHAIAPATARALAGLARRCDATLFMALLAAVQALLGRYAGQQDFAFGSPIANRTRAEVEPLIGFFVNTLVLRADLAGDPAFGELVARARRAALEAYSHQDLPFERLVEELRPERRLAHNPLFQVLCALQNAPWRAIALPGLTFSPVELEFPATRFDLEMLFTEVAAGLALQLTWSTDLFDAATVLRLAVHLDALLAAVIADPERPLASIPLLAAPEGHQLLCEWNDTAAEIPRQDLATLFAEQARLRPEAVAVAAEEGELTYGELDRRSGLLARRLAAAGVGPELRVALLARRSPAMVVGMLAILKAGGAYVPLDASYPAERLAWMLADSAARVLLGEPELLAGVPAGVPVPALVDLTAEPGAGPEPAGPLPDGLAYVMYTSGSTGRPKGVGVTHRNVVRLVRESRFADLGADQVFLQLAPVSFDASTLEIWAPLLNGGRLALYPPRRPSLEELGQVIAARGVTSLWLTAGLFHQVVEERVEVLRPLRQLLTGGDVLSPPHVRRALASLPGTTLINGYGPTESTTFACCFPMTHAGEVGPSVSLGRPIGNTRVHVLDPQLRPAVGGVWGELCVGGDGLARGYLGAPELTAERFVPDPFSLAAGARLYRTGDFARFRPDGRIDFLGRRDGQVKVRGYRVELGEIESALARHAGVREGVVVARDDGGSGGRRLVAYVVPRPAAAQGDGGGLPVAVELRRYLAAALPEPMVPSAFVLLDALPLTPNGKVDRSALPPPEGSGEDAAAWVAPASPLEALIAEAVADVLGRERVSMEDNFFDLGGHSLLATQLVSRLSRRHGIEVPLQLVFDAATLADLADRVVQQELESLSAEEVQALLAQPLLEEEVR